MRRRTVALLLAATIAAAATAGAALAEVPGAGWRKLVRATPLTDETAKSRGWVPKDFSFGPETPSFRAYAPADAKVETAGTSAEIEEGRIARLATVGKVTLKREGAAIETTVTAVRLKTPAAASRICDWGIGGQGYSAVASEISPDLSEADTLGFKLDHGRRTGGGYLACYTRRDWVMTVFVEFDLKSAVDKDTARRVTDAARDFAGVFVSNIRFADAAASGFNDRGTKVEAFVGADRIAIEVPDLWQVRINDFRGPLPAELHLTQEEDGKSRGAIWLAAQERKEQPDLESLGPELVKDYFRQQTPDAGDFQLLGAAEDPTFKAAGVPSRSFRLSVRNKAGEDIGDIRGAIYWKTGRLYVTSFWSHWSPSAGDEVFFARLPGLTAHDRIRIALLAALSDKAPNAP